MKRISNWYWCNINELTGMCSRWSHDTLIVFVPYTSYWEILTIPLQQKHTIVLKNKIGFPINSIQYLLNHYPHLAHEKGLDDEINKFFKKSHEKN